MSFKRSLLIFLAALLLPFAGSAAVDTPVDTPSVLITGASRGIGLALAAEYAGRGWQVIATARNPAAAPALQELARQHPNIVLEALDVTDHAQVDALAARYAGRPIDLLLNNAGISGSDEAGEFGHLDYATYARVHATNVVGPLKMAEAFLPNVAASRQKKIISISSTEGSIGLVKGRGGSYFYRSSKAALNMVMRSLAVDLKPRGITVGLVSPGLVRDDFTRGLDLPIMITPAQSAEAVARVIDGYELAMTGSFIRHTGKEAPW